MSRIKVSVFLLTYNQEKFIGQTIDSIVSQETDFIYELVIGEDCSNDKTYQICSQKAIEYPNKIKLLPRLSENIGLINNYIRTIKQCKGEYIAICDGDDYWVDSLKLQKQVDYLINNPQCDMVYTNYNKLYENGVMEEGVLNNAKQNLSFEHLITKNFIPSVTAMFKNLLLINKDFPEWINKYPYGDWQTYLWTIKDGGKIGFIDESTAVYRMDIGTSFKILKKNSNLLIVNISILEDMLRDLSFHKQVINIKNSLFHHNKDLMVSFIREDEHKKAFKVLVKLLNHFDNKFQVIKLYLFANFKKIQ